MTILPVRRWAARPRKDIARAARLITLKLRKPADTRVFFPQAILRSWPMAPP